MESIGPSAVSLAAVRSDGENSAISLFEYLPEVVLLKVFNKLPTEDLKNCRLTCSHWNDLILLSELLDMKSCFVFDGRRDDNVGGKCALYMRESPSKNYYWSHLKFRRVQNRQTPWLFEHLEQDPNFTDTISKLELLNCSINWVTILQIMWHLPNLYVFSDTQDMYCWDYQTFNSGIDEDEGVAENPNFLQLRNREKVENLTRIRVVTIHRSQLVECTTYIKILKLRCNNIRELSVTTDQNFAPQRALLFYTNLVGLLKQNSDSLKVLRFPFKLTSPSFDFRVTDEHHCFREFLNVITEQRWAETLQLPALNEMALQFGIIPVDNQDLKIRLLPFLLSFPSLRNFSMHCLLLESGMERFVEEFLHDLHHTNFKVQFGMYMNDAAGVPNIVAFQTILKSLSIQTFRETGKQFKDVIPLFGEESYDDLLELQYFSKNHTFRNFNIDLLVESFSNLTNLNLVDHNSRLETRHSCEAVATFEDHDMQLIIKNLRNLASLQLIANMVYLTDSGLTGICSEDCHRLRLEGQFDIEDIRGSRMAGLPLYTLQNLRYLVLRGLGVKVTDTTALFAFDGLPLLKKLHLYGCHQLSQVTRSALAQKFNTIRGCDLQV